MLKVYKVHNYVSIDGADWRQVNGGHTTSSAELGSGLLFDNLTFDEVREYLLYCRLDGVWNSSTVFINRPAIVVRYQDAWDSVIYKHFKKMSYKREFKEWPDVSLKWIMENLPADQTIQYLKERGITTCPMNF
jgi:hypothetical protein